MKNKFLPTCAFLEALVDFLCDFAEWMEADFPTFPLTDCLMAPLDRCCPVLWVLFDCFHWPGRWAVFAILENQLSQIANIIRAIKIRMVLQKLQQKTWIPVPGFVRNARNSRECHLAEFLVFWTDYFISFPEKSLLKQITHLRFYMLNNLNRNRI